MKLLKVIDYAAFKMVTEWTVRNWIKQGLPLVSKHPITINTEEAEKWLEERFVNRLLIKKEKEKK